MFIISKPTQAFLVILCAINLFTPQVTTQSSQYNLSSSIPTALSQGDLVNQTQANNTTSNRFLISNLNSSSNSTIASSISKRNNAITLNTKVTAPLSILGAFLIITGIPMAFWGGRSRWSCYFLTGAYLAALIVMIPILKFGIMGVERRTSLAIECVFVVICVVSGIGAGAVGVIFWKGTRFLVGALGGFVISLFILSLKNNSLIAAIGLRWVVILSGVSIGFVLATIPALTIHVTLFATAATGAAAIILGLDCFTTGGLKEFWLYIVGFGSLFPHVNYFPFTVTIQAELGLMAGLFVMGAAIQWRLLEYVKKKIDQLKRLDVERGQKEEAAAYRHTMALDADLTRWEKRHGEEADSTTGTVVDSIPNPSHYRKDSQYSLGHLESHSAAAPLMAYHDAPSDSKEQLPLIDGGINLADSLDITEDVSSSSVELKKFTIATADTPQVRTILPRLSVKSPTGNQSQPQASAPAFSSINFDKSVNDRRFSRPPGAPSSWTSPLDINKPGFQQHASNIKSSRPLSHHSHSAPPEELPYQTLKPKANRPLSGNLTARVNDFNTKLETKLPTEVPSRVIVGSYQAAVARSNLHPKRESAIMTVEELDQRHKHAMKTLQLPVTDKINGVTDQAKHAQEQHKRHSYGATVKNPDKQASSSLTTRNHEKRKSSDLLGGKPGRQREHTTQSKGASSLNNPNIPTASFNAHNTASEKYKDTRGWLEY